MTLLLYFCISMLPRYKRLVSFCLVLAILFSGNGIVLAIHTCFSTSSKSVSLFKNSSCCSSKESKCDPERSAKCESIASECCASEYSFFKLIIPSSHKKNLETETLFLPVPVIFYASPVYSDKVVFIPHEPFFPPESFEISHCQLLI